MEERSLNARDLSERLADRAAAVAEYLLPGGKKHGNLWRAGSINGEEGQSLAVTIRGDHKGRWKDFATGESGDLLDLFAMRGGLSIAQAMKEAADYLGVRLEEPLKPQKTYVRPRVTGTKPKSNVMAWLEGRGLTPETIAAFRLGANAEDTAVLMPYIRDGEVVNVKTRVIAEKKMYQAKDAEPCLFGWHLIDPKLRSIVITEGEIDAMTLHQVGIPALSGNQGAGNHQWIDSDFQRLERFSNIVICYDNDEAGQKGAREVVGRLGEDRCRIATFPAKDANEYLNQGATRDDFMRCILAAKSLDPDELVPASAFMAAVIRRMYPSGEDEEFFPPLYIGTEQPWFRFRPGEVTVWTGYNGHGKSQFLGQVMLGLMRMDERVLIFSGEMMPETLVDRATRQAAGTGQPSIPYMHHIGDWFATRFWVYKHVGAVDTDRLLHVFAYGAKRYGIKHFVVDSMMMLDDVPEEGKGALEAQRQLMLKLAAFAKKYAAHVNLVAHPRKGDDERKNPGKQDVSGSGKITSMADNVFSVWARLPDEGEEPDDGPSAKLELHKQRNGESQHRSTWMWFDTGSLQYRTRRDNRPIQFVDFDGRVPA